MHFVHFEKVQYKFICSVTLIQWLITVVDCLSKEVNCTYTDYQDKDIPTKCITYLENSGCSSENLGVEDEIGNPKIVISECSESYCNVRVNVSFIGKGSPILSVHGYDLQRKQFCLKIIFKTWTRRELIKISASVKLPRRAFRVTGYISDSSGKLKHEIFTSKTFIMNERKAKRSWNCRLVQCSLERYEIFNDTGLLRLFFKFEETTCDKESDNKATLFQLHDTKPVTEEMCKSYNNTDDHDIISNAVRYRKPVEISTQPLNFPNIETGCYVVRARPGCYFGFFWLNSTNNVDLNDWNTSILILPRENQGSIEVRWDWPSYPYNFTEWKLKLWMIDNYPVKCNGKNPMDKMLTTMTPPGFLTTNDYTFTNLSAGFYCFRIGGIDSRCPEDGCSLRASATVRFDPSRSESIERGMTNHSIPIILLVVAGIVVGICFSVICFRYNWTSKKRALQYELVAEKARIVDTPSVLLIWTKYSPANSPNPEPLIHVLKHLLRKYYLCQVYDYLDPLSLPKDQCLQLMSDPTSWLNSHLRKSDVKIIIIASDGAYWRQQELKLEKGPSLDAQLLNPFDQNLFPYVLNFLQESFNLSADYSRVFQVCFPDVFGQGMELDGLVASARYNMPEHMQELAYRIHGSNNYLPRLMKEPVNGELDELHEVISLLKKSRVEDK